MSFSIPGDFLVGLFTGRLRYLAKTTQQTSEKARNEIQTPLLIILYSNRGIHSPNAVEEWIFCVEEIKHDK